jgi:hypothetical protein
VPRLGPRYPRPEQLREALTLVGLGIDSEVDQKCEVFLSTKSDWLAGGCEKRGVTQATEVPSRFHEGFASKGEFTVCGSIN